MQRLSNSFAADIIAAISQGKTTSKQFLLALGLHNITGQRKVVEIVNRLGHCLTYNTTCEAEAAFSVKAQQLLSNCFWLLCPINEYGYVLTVFWVDSIDIKVEKQTGSTIVSTTPMIAFSRKKWNQPSRKKGTPLPRSRKRRLEEETNKNQDREFFFNSKIETPISTGEFSDPTKEHIQNFVKILSMTLDSWRK